ncbi:DUF3265 domain-containing protein [Vibrio splendidus]|nr:MULTISPECIES: DUF3265 domain-containing protein [Vibrio]PTQ16038.1 DUF3265 domain-containing protein [Vibrio splendidus]
MLIRNTWYFYYVPGMVFKVLCGDVCIELLTLP